MRLLGRVLVFVLVLVVGVVLAKNLIAKAAIQRGVKSMMGLDLHIGRMDVGLANTAIGIHDLKLHNPSGFPEPMMIDVPEIYVNYDLGAFVQGRVHLEEVRLNLREFTVMKDQQGRLNVDALKVVQESKGKPAQAEAPRTEKGANMQVDVLQLKVDKVVYKDYSKRSRFITRWI